MAPGEKGECEGGCNVGWGGVGLQWQCLNWEKQGAEMFLSSPL